MKNIKVAVIGLGYVGLPLARLFATKYPVVGFDINQRRIDELTRGVDSTREVESSLLAAVLKTNALPAEGKGLLCTAQVEDIRDCSYYIITVPTPVDKYNRPDLTPLLKASQAVGSVLKRNDIVIYESTVYPGATEEDCVPVLEQYSGLQFNRDFYAGYSPERINPGDKEHTVEKIKKITSGSTKETGEKVDALYRSVITAGTHLAPSIKVAEAAKVIENSQRDINIAFVNELAKIFNSMGIDTHEVLKAASTKWNFLAFKPGLVGGHCIGVDPYYLAQKAQEYGYHPEIILAGRRMNDGMGEYIANQTVKGMIQHNIPVKGSNVLVLGITFKENCPDIRNSKVADVVKFLNEYGVNTTVYDPYASPEEVEHEYGITLSGDIEKLYKRKFGAIILAVAHASFKNIPASQLLVEGGFIYDVKGFLEKYDARL
jgi:UDP-N-acetyl-D-galactosamine dehydrogenase